MELLLPNLRVKISFVIVFIDIFDLAITISFPKLLKINPVLFDSKMPLKQKV